MEHEQMITAVIFDMDGTLVNFNFDYKTVRAEVIRLLVEQGFPSSIFSIRESIFEMLKKAEIYMKNNGRGEREVARVKEEVLSMVDRHELEAARSTNLLPGVLETLKVLKQMGLKMAVFTLSGEKSTDHILRSFRLTPFFDAVVTRESALAVKPDSTHLETVLKKLNVEPNEAIVVGDGVSDMKCARELNVIAVGVTTGISSPKELTRAGANYLASSCTDLPILVQQLNKQNLKDI